MPYTTKNFPPFIATSSGSALSNAVGKLDDCSSITIYISSSAAPTGPTLQVSQFDPNDPIRPVGVGNSLSTNFFAYSLTTTEAAASAVVLTSGFAFTFSNISWRGMRLATLTSAIAGEVVATASGQFSV